MQCQTCTGYALKPVELAPGLIAAQCSKCDGASIAMLNLRFWIDQQTDCATPVPADVTSVDDFVHARQCVKCQRLMTKYRVCNALENRLDVCHACDEVWFDKGEWQAVVDAGLIADLPAKLTDAGQRALREAGRIAREKAFFAETIGEGFERVDEFRDWLRTHPNGAEIRRYLLLN
ncbi:Uncharacterised protein [BD1-7 clade bacterium]|uniref:Transcription factor zinc-finger domain-containing protein n=1 Tax=BD1-7 clade bacterium TaxID=2029982 RepID=A0A5S9NTP2_9GAMM|nr:Uncharacterised protein [BD1-7 clade bacterium]CAA0094023.1 Uncharacterised protein [BD1-7 clade bacterium]